MQKINFVDMNELSELFGEEEHKKICDAITTKFSSFLNDEFFELETGFKKNRIQIKLILKNRDESILYPIECVYIHESDTEFIPRENAISMLDYLESYFEEFFSQDRNVYLPIDWSAHQSEGLNFFARGFVRNLKIEKIADELLSKHGHGEYHIQPISSEF